MHLMLHLPATLDAARQAGDMLRLALEQRFGSSAQTYSVQLICAEVLSNIVRHNGAVHGLLIKCAGTGKALRITVEDDGLPFDMTQLPALLPADPLAESGRGMWLIRQKQPGAASIFPIDMLK